jgi:hypothetical protein
MSGGGTNSAIGGAATALVNGGGGFGNDALGETLTLDAFLAPGLGSAAAAAAGAGAGAGARQGLTLVHVRAQLERLQDTLMS